MKTYAYISALFISIISMGIGGCMHHGNKNLLTEKVQDSLQENDLKISGYAAQTPPETPNRRKPHSYRISEDAEIDDADHFPISSVSKQKNDGKHADRFSTWIQQQNILDEALELCTLAQNYWQKGQLENALSALDQAYALVIKVDTFNRPKLIQQKEDIRFLISKRIQDIYSSRNVVSKGSMNAIPKVMNEYVKAEIESLANGSERNFFINSYKRSGRYFKHIEQELAKEGLPLELAWLPLVESGFNVRALSPARALGLWQFIPSTGLRFGLSRDQYIDERLDPYKSTRAAIAYMKELHHFFGDWETVLAAYNCGEGRVLRTINTQNINYLDNFWDLYVKLPRETARYVPRFHATLHIISNLKKYGLDDISPEPPLEFETIPVSRQLDIKSIAESTEILESTLKMMNPELRHGIIPGDNYPLKIPVGSADFVLGKLDQISETRLISREESDRSDLASHKVKRGETLEAIAKFYGTSKKGILLANKMKSENIEPGRVLLIPKKTPTPPEKPSPVSKKPEVAKKTEPPKPTVHAVKSGDSLFNIAKRYGVTVKNIQNLNKLNSTDIVIGQNLTIPDPSKTVAEEPIFKKYMVKHGDNSFSIASSHNMPVDRFLSINNLSPNSKIFPGQKVYVE